MTLLLRGGHLIDPAVGLDQSSDLLIQDGKVTKIGQNLALEASCVEVDSAGYVVCPGWIDMHVHLRSPGQEHKETVATGTAAAAAGGFTAIACMPNTDPSLDSVEALSRFARECREHALIPVHPIAAITLGRAGGQVVDFDALAAAGAIGFSDDGCSTANSSLMTKALTASERLGLPVMVHCEDPSLVGGSMHEGDVSRQLGVKGIPAAAEEAFIARDCLLAASTGGWLHVLHVSTGNGLAVINLMRGRGARVTAEVMPHHLVMSDEWIAGTRQLHNTDESGTSAAALHPNTKVNPPLRTVADTEKLLAGLQRGDFDILATDHAPHTAAEKSELKFESAAFGMIGSELAVPVMLALVRAGRITLPQLIYRFSTVPSRLWNLPVGRLEPGGLANLAVIDPGRTWLVDEQSVQSKSKNTPLLGMRLTGRNVMTILDGAVIHDIRT